MLHSGSRGPGNRIGTVYIELAKNDMMKLDKRVISVIYIVQNLFHQGKGSRSISLNSHYLLLFKNPRDKLQILTLAKQMYPGQTDFFFKSVRGGCKKTFWLSAD